MSSIIYLHEHINIPLLQYFHSLTQYPFVENIVLRMADIPIFFVPIFLVAMWIYAAIQKQNTIKHTLLVIFYSCFIAVWTNLIIQYFVHIDRPETALTQSGKLIIEHIPDASFPSDHASVSIAFLISIFLYWYRKTTYVIAPFFVLMLLSRIAGWVHWPFDILVWSIIWAGSAGMVYALRNIKIITQINTFLIKIASYIKL